MDDYLQAAFFLKLSVSAAQNDCRKLASLDAELRRVYMKSVEDRYLCLYDVLIKTGRTEEAYHVLNLLKGEELRKMEHGLADTAAAAGIRDLFSGTGDEAAFARYSSPAETDAEIAAEHAALLDKRA